MTLLPLLRLIPALRCRSAPRAPVTSTARTAERRPAPAQQLISQAGLDSLYSLCERIEAGYDAGKCMYDSGMTSLAETLTSSTGEIKSVIVAYAHLRNLLVNLHGYDHFEVTGLECDDEYQALKRAAAAVGSGDAVDHAV